MNRRLQQFLDAENITQAQFAAKVKVAPASISHILAGRNKPGYDFIRNTIQAFPDLNVVWLITGQGKMYSQSSPSPNSLSNSDTISKEVDRNSIFPEDDSGNGLLFPEESNVSTPPESHIPLQLHDQIPNIQFSTREQPPVSATQQTVRQRKASRIMVFYDDGTFQEFR